MEILEQKVLVLGIGNILMQDDGLGPMVVRELGESYPHSQVEYLDGGTLGLDLLAYLEGYHTVLIVDALDLGKNPGEIFYWEGQTLSGLTQQVSFHQVGVKELLQAMSLLDLNIKIAVIGLQIAEISWGISLSEPVQGALPKFKNAIIDKVNSYLNVS